MVHGPVTCRRFIGRNEELAFLSERRLLAAKSQGSLVLVSGEAGIGKSRLLREFAAPLAKSRWRFGTGSCFEFVRRSYGPVLDVLDDWERGGRSDLVPAATKREQFAAIGERVERLAATASLVGIFEDVHWADTATLELLAYLAGVVANKRILLVASFRPNELSADDPSFTALEKVVRAARFGRVDLTPLEGDTLARFVDETLDGRSLPPRTCEAIAKTSEGNPFFAEELLRDAVERGAPASHGGPDRVDIPSSLRATLLERYRAFSPGDRAILAQAAVIGRVFALPLLERTLAIPQHVLLETLARARDRQLVEETGTSTFRFRHALTRRAIYNEFLGAQVRALHGKIASTLEASPELDGSLEGLAYHAWAAGYDEPSARYNVLAGDASARVHAHEDAIAFYERALESAALDLRARATIAEKIAERYQALGVPDRRSATYAIAADYFRQVGDDDSEARCRVYSTIAAYTAGHADSLEPLDRMLERLPETSRVARARVHLGIAWLAATLSQPSRAAAHLRSVHSSALAELDVAHRYHNVAAWVAMLEGDRPAFVREFEEWKRAAEATGAVGALASANLNGAVCLVTFALHEEAIAACENALQLARAEKNRLSEEAALANLAIAQLFRGDLAAVCATLERIPPVPETFVTLANASAVGVLAAAYLGDETMMDRWLPHAIAAVEKSQEADAGAGVAEVFVRREEFARARQMLHLSIPDSERVRGIAQTLVAVAKHGALEDIAHARAQLAAAAQSPSDVVERHSLALFDAYMARRNGRGEEARRLALAAADGFARLRLPLFEADAAELAGDVARALALYRRCGATYNAAQLESLSGFGPVKPAAARAVSLFSPREREIAELVAKGISNAEVGRTLGISHKTVEKHLGSLYQKLGISSRVQLVAHVISLRDLAG